MRWAGTLFCSACISTFAVAEDKYVKVPTLGGGGMLDHTLKEMQELKKLRPAMTLVLVEGAPHSGPAGIQGRPELLAAIREFIARHAQ